MIKASLLSGFLLTISLSTQASICGDWSPSQEVGQLNSDIISEASGLAISRIFDDRLFHINDSGDEARFYITEESGANTQTVNIENFTPIDVEDLAYGTCHHRQTCLYIGDIGDNREHRETIKIVVIEESEKFGKSTTPISILTAKYPDRPHNAEGMAVHPNGDIYIITKEYDRENGVTLPAQIFKLTKETQERKEAIKTLDYVGELDIPSLLKDTDKFGKIVTSFDISPDGKKIAIMTYRFIIEANLDFGLGNFRATSEWRLGEDYSVTKTRELPQQEALSYYPDGSTILYDTEYHESEGPASLNQLQCIK